MLLRARWGRCWMRGWGRVTAGRCRGRLRGFGNPSTWGEGRLAETSRSAGMGPGTALCNFLTRSKKRSEGRDESNGGQAFRRPSCPAWSPSGHRAGVGGAAKRDPGTLPHTTCRIHQVTTLLPPSAGASPLGPAHPREFSNRNPSSQRQEAPPGEWHEAAGNRTSSPRPGRVL